MTDDTFESTLRAWLADRAPAGASPSLSARIAAVPVEAAPSGRLAIGRPARWVASFGLAASFVVALAWVATRGVLVRPGDGSVGATPSLPTPPLPSLDPTVEGVGVVVVGFQWLPAIILATAVIGLAAVILLERRRWVRSVAGFAVVAMVASASMISSASWIGFGPIGAWAAGLGFDHWGTETQTVAGSDHAFFHVRPGEPFTFSFTLTNHAPVPITIEGMVQDPPNAGFRFTGLGLQRPVPGVDPDGWTISADPAENVPFAPVQIEPGANRLIVVTGKAGPCAGGWDDAGNATSMSTDTITLAYSALGVERTEQVRLPLTVEIPIVGGCSG